MFIWSVKTSKKEIILLILGILVFIGSLIFAFWPSNRLASSNSVVGGVSCTVQTAEQRTNFLRAFGWDINTNPVEVREIIIPLEFSDVYIKYNGLQKQQGFDLEQYKGKKVKLWTYEIINYPEKEGVYANMLVHEGTVIGGDICSNELDGFMHGFNAESGASYSLSAQDVFASL